MQHLKQLCSPQSAANKIPTYQQILTSSDLNPILQAKYIFACVIISCFLTACGGSSSEPELPETEEPVTAENSPPLANAGDDIIVVSGVTVTLVGESSDAEGNVNVLWVQNDGPNILLSNSDTDTLSFVAPVVTTQLQVSFTFTVTDNGGAQTSDTVTVTILPVVDDEPAPPPTSTSLFIEPVDLVIDTARNRAIISDRDTATLVAVDLDSFERSIFSDHVTPNNQTTGTLRT